MNTTENLNAQVSFDAVGLSWTLFDGEGPEHEALKQRFDHINDTLREMEDAARLKAAIGFLKVWHDGYTDQVAAKMGDCWRLRSMCKAMISVTGDKRQIRVWHSFPKSVSYDDVGGHGGGLLFGVYGPSEILDTYLREFLNVVGSCTEVRLKAGRLYMNF